MMKISEGKITLLMVNMAVGTRQQKLTGKPIIFLVIHLFLCCNTYIKVALGSKEYYHIVCLISSVT